MKLTTSIIILLIATTSSIGQIAPNTLLKLPEATTADINLSAAEGAGNVVYSSDENKVYVHTGIAFEKILIGPQYYVGSFQITAAGPQNIIGLPFQPSSLTFYAYANIESANINDDNDVIPDADNVNTLANSFGGMKGYARLDSGPVISEQVIYNGGNGTSINDISRYASSSHCIGIRYGNQNGDQVGLTTATLTSFDTNGFTINTDAFSDGLLVIYEAYK